MFNVNYLFIQRAYIPKITVCYFIIDDNYQHLDSCVKRSMLLVIWHRKHLVQNILLDLA